MNARDYLKEESMKFAALQQHWLNTKARAAQSHSVQCARVGDAIKQLAKDIWQEFTGLEGKDESHRQRRRILVLERLALVNTTDYQCDEYWATFRWIDPAVPAFVHVYRVCISTGALQEHTYGKWRMSRETVFGLPVRDGQVPFV